MLKPIFYNLGDIRMASPYLMADKTLIKGAPWFEIPDDYQRFQDKYVIDPINEELLYIVIWEHLNNNPFFRVVFINNEEKGAYLSNYFLGCCDKIYIKDNYLHVDVYQFIRKYNDDSTNSYQIDSFPFDWSYYINNYDLFQINKFWEESLKDYAFEQYFSRGSAPPFNVNSLGGNYREVESLMLLQAEYSRLLEVTRRLSEQSSYDKKIVATYKKLFSEFQKNSFKGDYKKLPSYKAFLEAKKELEEYNK